eukprot:tig00020902_g15005.t1
MEADGKIVNNDANCGTCYSDKTCTTALTGTYHRNACWSSGLGFKNNKTGATCVAKPGSHLDDEVQVAMAEDAQEAEYEAELEALNADVLAELESALAPMVSETVFAESE